MSMHDPIADMLTRIRNGQKAQHQQIRLSSSNLKLKIADVLKNEGYILSYSVETTENNFKIMVIDLKYYSGKSVIDRIRRVSRPGLRVYKSYKDLIAVSSFGIAILSTSKGVMTHIEARNKKVGGELLCEVA